MFRAAPRASTGSRGAPSRSTDPGMNLTNATKYLAASTMGMEPSGRELLVVVVKGTFDIPADAGPVVRSRHQVPLVEADTFAGEPGLSAPLAESDFAPKKAKCDV